jgi:hypothetical protein
MNSERIPSHPIVVALNLRDGNFGKTLRSRKGLKATGNVVILPQDNLNTIIEKVRKCLPVNFIWNDMAEPVRFQRAKEQPQHTLELLESEPVVTIFELLDDIRAKSMKRYTDLNFNYHSVSFWIFGFWTSKTQQTPPITPPLSKSNMGDILSVQQTDALQKSIVFNILSDEERTELLKKQKINNQLPSLNIPAKKDLEAMENLLRLRSDKEDTYAPSVNRKHGLLFLKDDEIEGEQKKSKVEIESDYVTIPVLLDGVSLPLQFKRSSLMAALNLK